MFLQLRNDFKQFLPTFKFWKFLSLIIFAIKMLARKSLISFLNSTLKKFPNNWWFLEIEVFGLVETQIQTLGTKPIISRNKTTAATALAWAMQSKQVDHNFYSVSSKEN